MPTVSAWNSPWLQKKNRKTLEQPSNGAKSDRMAYKWTIDIPFPQRIRIQIAVLYVCFCTIYHISYLVHGRRGRKFKYAFSNTFYRMIPETILVKLPTNEFQRTTLVMDRSWYRSWLNVARQEAMTQANIEQCLRHGMASLGHDIANITHTHPNIRQPICVIMATAYDLTLSWHQHTSNRLLSPMITTMSYEWITILID